MNERTCVGCFVRSSDYLLRVKSIDGELHFDLLGKLAGRGCWIHPTFDCLNQAISRRVFQISSLLNKVRSIIPEDKNLEDTLRDILELSSVTNLEAFDKQPVKELNLNNLLKSFKVKFDPIQFDLKPPEQ